MDTHRARGVLDVLTSLVLLAAATLIVVSRFGGGLTQTARTNSTTLLPVPAEPVSLAGALVHGAATAPYALLAFSEFECPFCVSFANDVVPVLEEGYIKPGRLLFAFRHFPLVNHKFARRSAVGVECANRAGRFWPAHRALFALEGRLSEVAVRDAARSASIGDPHFDDCFSVSGGKAKELDAEIEADVSLGRRLGVRGTPTFFIGTVLPDSRLKVVTTIVGARPVEEFTKALDALTK